MKVEDFVASSDVSSEEYESDSSSSEVEEEHHDEEEEHEEEEDEEKDVQPVKPTKRSAKKRKASPKSKQTKKQKKSAKTNVTEKVPPIVLKVKRPSKKKAAAIVEDAESSSANYTYSPVTQEIDLCPASETWDNTQYNIGNHTLRIGKVYGKAPGGRPLVLDCLIFGRRGYTTDEGKVVKPFYFHIMAKYFQPILDAMRTIEKKSNELNIAKTNSGN